MENPFFKKKKNIKINDILIALNLKTQKINFLLNDIKELGSANKNDITFFNSIKYLELLKKTQSRLVITSKKFIAHMDQSLDAISVVYQESLDQAIFITSVQKQQVTL